MATLTLSNSLQTAWDFLQKGGIFMIPLGITALAGSTAILYKWLSLSNRFVVPLGLARQVAKFPVLTESERQESVFQVAQKGQSALARLVAVVARHRDQEKSEITTAVEVSAREELARLHTGIGILDTAITIAPLLGLLGTASGLVTIFQGLSESADHMGIARGIAEALTTTIVGLAIAVPCVVAHGHFTRRIELLTVRLEALLADLVHACQKLAIKP